MQRKRTVFVFFLSMIIILSSGCLSSPGNFGAPSTSSSRVGENTETSTARIPSTSGYWEHEVKNRTTSINDSINSLAVDLYRELARDDGNIFFSPFSIETALAMVYEGARGTTAEEMERVLNLPKKESLRHNGFRLLILSLNSKDTACLISTANALWVQDGYPVKGDYTATIERYYLGELHTVDFLNNPRGAEDEINRWVEERTNGRIKNLVSGVSPDTRLVLTNAVYFKANWSHRFNAGDTHNGTFFLPNGTTTVPFMEQTGIFNYAETESFQAFELPYEGKRISMIILLPRKGDELEKLEANLRPEFLDEVIKSLRPKKIDVILPKFRFEASYRLKDVLMEMGMRRAFTNADFSGISDEPLAIDQVIHKSFISVGENGTEAAAATAVVMFAAAAPANEKPTVFRADHPFVFFIYDRGAGTILFVGRLMDPKG